MNDRADFAPVDNGSQHNCKKMSRLFRNLQVYELAQRIYPRDVVPYLNLEVAYWDTGDYDKALTEGLAASRLDPVSVNVNRVATYIYLDRMDEAESILKQIEQRSQSLTDHRYRLAFLKGDGKDMDRLVVEAAGTRSEDLLLGLHAQHPGVLRTFKESTGDHTTLDGISHASGRQRERRVYPSLHCNRPG
jgi:tetratricopeptide (TPR) repeat protein